MNPDEAKKRKRSKHLCTAKVVLVRIVAQMLPHDSPEFIEHAKRGRPANAPPIPEWMRRKPNED